LRSLRFAISVLTPPGVCWALHYDQGIVFALVPSIASFSTDPGGPPLSRLIWAAGGGMAFVAGNVAGGLVPNGAESAALFAADGAIYAFSESLHQLVVTIARFLCFGMAIGAFYAHATLLDVAIVASAVAFVFLVSLATDLLRGGLRASTAPTLREFIDGIEARETERLVSPRPPRLPWRSPTRRQRRSTCHGLIGRSSRCFSSCGWISCRAGTSSSNASPAQSAA
jgi:hypothetical protein